MQHTPGEIEFAQLESLIKAGRYEDVFEIIAPVLFSFRQRTISDLSDKEVSVFATALRTLIRTELKQEPDGDTSPSAIEASHELATLVEARNEALDAFDRFADLAIISRALSRGGPVHFRYTVSQRLVSAAQEICNLDSETGARYLAVAEAGREMAEKALGSEAPVDPKLVTKLAESIDFELAPELAEKFATIVDAAEKSGKIDSGDSGLRASDLVRSVCEGDTPPGFLAQALGGRCSELMGTGDYLGALGVAKVASEIVAISPDSELIDHFNVNLKLAMAALYANDQQTSRHASKEALRFQQQISELGLAQPQDLDIARAKLYAGSFYIADDDLREGCRLIEAGYDLLYLVRSSDGSSVRDIVLSYMTPTYFPIASAMADEQFRSLLINAFEQAAHVLLDTPAHERRLLVPILEQVRVLQELLGGFGETDLERSLTELIMWLESNGA